ncbi:hypothetical protein CGMCC3_g17840 [Colletotrichum fructicola]|nr:uncharacterized protein CGMCC3_g17840 [Colletotrichum fructicola]KAE9565986.1 hypothetical protein CGMCC3_g17840 [Colletotrichum fructicola]
MPFSLTGSCLWNQDATDFGSRFKERGYEERSVTSALHPSSRPESEMSSCHLCCLVTGRESSWINSQSNPMGSPIPRPGRSD